MDRRQMLKRIASSLAYTTWLDERRNLDLIATEYRNDLVAKYNLKAWISAGTRTTIVRPSERLAIPDAPTRSPFNVHAMNVGPIRSLGDTKATQWYLGMMQSHYKFGTWTEIKKLAKSLTELRAKFFRSPDTIAGFEVLTGVRGQAKDRQRHRGMDVADERIDLEWCEGTEGGKGFIWIPVFDSRRAIKVGVEGIPFARRYTSEHDQARCKVAKLTVHRTLNPFGVSYREIRFQFGDPMEDGWLFQRGLNPAREERKFLVKSVSQTTMLGNVLVSNVEEFPFQTHLAVEIDPITAEVFSIRAVEPLLVVDGLLSGSPCEEVGTRDCFARL